MMGRIRCSHLILLLLAATASQLSLAQLDYEETPPSEYVVRNATPEGRVHVVVTKTKHRIRLAKTQQPIARLALNDDNTDYYDEALDLQVGYRRPELVNQTADVNLSDNIKLRLAIARIKALQAYNANWA